MLLLTFLICQAEVQARDPNFSLIFQMSELEINQELSYPSQNALYIAAKRMASR